MRKFLFLILTVIPWTMSAQSSLLDSLGIDTTRQVASSVQYWFDENYTRGTLQTMSGTQQLDVSSLDIGLHTLHLQIVHTDGSLGYMRSAMFVKTMMSDSTSTASLRYWFDEDYSSIQMITTSVRQLDVSALSIGLHTLHMQVVHTDNTVGYIRSAMFIKAMQTDSTGASALRYWFDENDSTVYTTTSDVQQLDVSALSLGQHTLHMQVVHDDGSVGYIRSEMFIRGAMEFSTNDTICEGTTYSWRDSAYTTAGSYFDTIRTAAGEDSIRFSLQLEVNPSYIFVDTVSLCPGEIYRWRGMTFSEAGMYTDSLTTRRGCDSIYVLELSIQSRYDTSEEVSICAGESYFWHGQTPTETGQYMDTMLTIYGCDSLCTLNLIVNPTYLIEEIVAVREDKLPYQWNGQTITQPGNYRAEYTSLAGCDSIITLQFTVTALPIYTVIVEADHGHVNGTGTYPEGTQIHLEAVPDEGFEFQMWSDTRTENPKDFVVTQDTTFRAHFFMPEVEQEVTVDSIETRSVMITWTAVPNATLYELRLYEHGKLIVMLHVDPSNTIIDQFRRAAYPIVARRDSTGGSSETLQVDIGGLKPGVDYTYSLDSFADDRSFVGAQSGAFTTEREQSALETIFDDRRQQPRKILQDGRLYIELPDGTHYDARGVLLE